MFNYTEGYGYVTMDKPTAFEWWLRPKTVDWLFACKQDEFNDAGACTMEKTEFFFNLYSDFYIDVRIGLNPQDYTEGCYRADKNVPICAYTTDPLSGENANEAYQTLLNSNQFMTRFTDAKGNKQTMKFNPEGADVSYLLINGLVAKIK